MNRRTEELSETEVFGWHWTDGPKLRDGTPLERRVYRHNGPLVLCESGYHLSRRAIDSLRYAPGATVSRVVARRSWVEDGEKLVTCEREVLWFADGEETLRSFARWCAFQVIDAWAAPAVVRRWLETGDPSLRIAVRIAARRAAWSAAESADDIADWSAARSAAESAAGSTAESAAREVQNAELERRLLALEPKQ